VDPFRPWPTPYVVHKWAVIVGFALWAIGLIAGKLVIIAAGGVAFIAAGVAAMLARRSLMTGVTIGFLSFEWTTEAAGSFGNLFAWQFGKEVRVIRLDAKPLEP
jgi:hypothetical protein